MKLHVLVATVVTTLALVSVVLAWTEPTAAPPGNNVAAPVNVGPIRQDKLGGFGAGTLTSFGISLINPAAGDAYQNYWSGAGSVTGSTGYGFRSTAAGVMEYKDRGGAWQAFSSLSGGGSGSFASSKQYHFYHGTPNDHGVSTGLTFQSRCETPSFTVASTTGQLECIRSNSVSTVNTATLTSQQGWTFEGGSASPIGAQGTNSTYGGGVRYKVIPDQGTTPWSLCTMTGIEDFYVYITTTSAGVAASDTQSTSIGQFVMKRNDGKWYMFYSNHIKPGRHVMDVYCVR